MRRTKLRSKEMHDRYENAEKDPHFIENAPTVLLYDFWRVIPNEFPYDEIAKTHHMLVPKRQFTFHDNCDRDEQEEFTWLMRDVLPGYYDMISYNFPHQQSQPHWLHYHLIVLK